MSKSEEKPRDSANRIEIDLEGLRNRIEEKIAAAIAEEELAKHRKKKEEEKEDDQEEEESQEKVWKCENCGRTFTQDEVDHREACPECGSESIIPIDW